MWDRRTLWLDVAMLDEGFICSSVLIDLLAFCFLFFWPSSQYSFVYFGFGETDGGAYMDMEF